MRRAGTKKPLEAYDLSDGRARWNARRAGYDVPLRHIEAKGFWEQVHKTESCWLWTGSIGRGGYGRFRKQREGLDKLAHRWCWIDQYGAIPDGLYVCHKCDIPLCVRPDHLFLGTHADNMLDKCRKGRARGNTSKRGWRLVLSTSDLEAMRELSGTISIRAIGRQFGVSYSAARAVLGLNA